MFFNLLFALALGISPEPMVRWITPADYPAALLTEAKQGTVDFELTFNPEGRVTGCVIQKSSGTVLLDVITCRVSARRARAIEGEARVQAFRHAWKPPTD